MKLSSLNNQSLINTRHTLLFGLERFLPCLLPVLLIFSRSIADLTVLITGIVFLIISFHRKDWAWAKNTWFRLNILFWLYILLINTPISIHPTESFIHAFLYLRWPLFAAALAYWLFIDDTRQRYFLIALAVVCVFIFFDTSLQYTTGQDLFGHTKASSTRLTGPFTRPIPGIMMLRVLFIVLFLSIVSHQTFSPLKRIVFTLFTLCAGLLFMFITGERMALLLFFAGSSIVLVVLLIEQKVHRAKILIGLLLIMGLSVVFILLNPETAQRSIYSIYDKLLHFADSDYGLVFRAALAAFERAPILGHGFHTYRVVCEEMGILAQWGMQCSHPHNLYLQIAAECGFIGLVLFICMVVSLYFKAFYQLILLKKWFVLSLNLVVLSVSFSPFIGGISILNNGVAALVWLGVGWTIAMSATSGAQPYAN